MQTIGKFEVLGSLGKGSQSVVLLARDPDLDRKVAIKLLRMKGQPAERRYQLLNEARSVGALRHPGIVPVYEAGGHGSDPYLVFEHVDGPTLSQLLREQGRLPPERTAALLLDVLDALSHAHVAGIVHRDLKPSNILIDANGHARVMDFGIATRIGAASDAGAGLVGTPAYMAPEYVAHGKVGPQGDVFAAGLLLYEMLFGQRAIRGDDVFQVLHRLANEPLVLPADALEIAGEALIDVLVKATAREPALRFPDARAMHQALHRYLHPDPAAEDNAETAAKGASTLNFLLLRMRHKSDFPAMSVAIGTINQLALSERSNAASLANAILKDLALTNKVLRLSNSALYGNFGPGKVSTVSRAIVILGFETVRNLAISLTLFENIRDKQHAETLRDEFLRANLRGLLARTLSESVAPGLGEQAFICGLFHTLGRLLAHYYFREEAEMIRRLATAEACGEEAAARRVLGMTYEELGIGIARSWGFPDPLLHSMRDLPEGRVPRAENDTERMRLLAVCADELAATLELPSEHAREVATNALVQRYAGALPLSGREIKRVAAATGDRLRELARVLQITSKTPALAALLAPPDAPSPAPGQDSAATDTATRLVASVNAEAPEMTQEPPTTVDTEAVLAAGIQDMSQALIDDNLTAADQLCAIAEIIYRALGARRVMVCLRDPAGGWMRARHGFGTEVDHALAHLRFALGGKDLFNLILARDVDVLVSDASAEKIHRHLPDWFHQHFDAQSFIVLPLRLRQAPVAMIYAEAAKAGGIRVSPEALSQLRTLRNQALLAIRQGG